MVIIVIAVVVPVAILKHQNNLANGSSGSDQSGNATFGMSGSTITMDDGTKFIYQNSFEGDWVADPKIPFGSGERLRVGANELGLRNGTGVRMLLVELISGK